MRGMLTLNLSFLVQSIAIARPTIAHTALQQTGALRDFRRVYDRFGSGADITCHLANVRFTPQSGHRDRAWKRLLRANRDLRHCSKQLVQSPRRPPSLV